MLKEKTGKLYPFVNFAGIHMFPTLVVYLCILPAVTAITEGFEFKPLCIPFLLLSTAAFIIQGIADFQMHRFRKRGEGTFIREGLWKHSRHPNYLGEILMWWGIGLGCVAAKPEQWYLLAGAVLNTCLFLFVSIPMAEKHQSRKEGFELMLKESLKKLSEKPNVISTFKEYFLIESTYTSIIKESQLDNQITKYLLYTYLNEYYYISQNEKIILSRKNYEKYRALRSHSLDFPSQCRQEDFSLRPRRHILFHG